MTINITAPELRELKPRIVVLGVGGAGGNAINNMLDAQIEGVEFFAANTDAQALKSNFAECKIQLGANLTRGLGAGAKADIGQAAADEVLGQLALRCCVRWSIRAQYRAVLAGRCPKPSQQFVRWKECTTR